MKNIEKYQKLIAKGEVDALLLTSKHNRQYAAEYCIAEGVAVICKTQSYYFTDFRYIESAQKNLPGFAVKMVDTEHPYTKLINEAISDNTVKTIGFEDDTLTVEEYTLYNTKLNAVLHPYAAEINAPRASKEPWEIEYMKKAQEITDRTFDDLLNVIHPGMTEKELCAELIYRLYKYGSEGPSFDPITVSGPNTSLPHGVPSERVLQYGDFVTMDFGCLYHGYCSDMTRTFFCKTADPKYAAIHDLVRSANEIAEGMIRPGIPLRELDIAAREHIASAGYGEYFTHRLGHFIGQTEHEKGDVSAVTELVAKPGMIFSIEPGVYLPGQFGVRVEDLVLVTEEGCEILNRVDKHWKTVG